MRVEACLIVRDVAGTVAGCLESLRGFVDGVVVHDTGSTDGTLELLRTRDLRLVEGSWYDNFAAARNTALDAASADWVLTVDADEVARGRPEEFRRWLAGRGEREIAVDTRNAEADGGTGYEYSTVKLFRPEGVRWRGRVHERPVFAGLDEEAPVVLVPPDLLLLDHTGYADAGARARKGARNFRIAARELEDLLVDPSTEPEEIARVTLHIGRSAVGAGDLQRAVDAFEAVRELQGQGRLWNEATDYLARVLLGAGEAELGIVLADQLARAGVAATYCRWLRAQGLAQTGRPAEALAELEGLTTIVDTASRRHDPAALDALRGLCREALGA